MHWLYILTPRSISSRLPLFRSLYCPMSQITVSLETAKKMKKTGRNKQTHFVHKELRDIKYSWAKGMHYIHIMLPTAQEILDELPRNLWKNHFDITHFWMTIIVWYIYMGTYLCKYESKNLVEVFSNVRLRCKENWYI